MKHTTLLFCLLGFLSINANAQAPNEFSFKKSYPLSAPAKISVSTNDGFIRMNSGQSDQIEIYFIVKKDNRLVKIDLNELMN